MGLTNNLKILRAQHNYTQEDLAQKLGVTRQTIIAIESGKYLPSLPLAFKIAELFKTQLEKIFINSEK